MSITLLSLLINYYTEYFLFIFYCFYYDNTLFYTGILSNPIQCLKEYLSTVTGAIRTIYIILINYYMLYVSTLFILHEFKYIYIFYKYIPHGIL